jgi:ABC-type branched-subunit amino acid transport system ATPase component
MTSSSAHPQAGRDESTEVVSTGNATAAPRVRLVRLKINRFRHVKPGVELRFDNGINVLLGRNGVGKTTLLELICALVGGDLRSYQRESFDLEFDLVLGDEHVAISAHNHLEYREKLTALINDDAHDSTWHYHIRFGRSDGSSHHIEAAKGQTRVWVGDGAEPPTPTALTESPLFVSSFYERCVSAALGIGELDFRGFKVQQRLLANNCLRLDEGLDVFNAITNGLPLPHLPRPLGAILLSGFPWGNSVRRTQWLLEMIATYMPVSLLECLLQHGEPIHHKTEVGISSAEWGLLAELKALIGVRDLQVTMQLVGREELEESGLSSVFGKPVFRIITHRGTTVTHDGLSYGEKRLLAFMYHAAANPQILVSDEVVNGMHPRWIGACLEAIRGQAFLTSQNPLLLDHLTFASAEEAQRRLVLCDADENGSWTWRNMELDAADAFHRAHQAGLQHVGEVLRTSGLW